MNDTPGAACYVYGVMGADAAGAAALPAAGVRGRPVETVASGSLAALVTHVGEERVRATRADLRAHQQVVEDVAVQATVLPMQFGVVAASADEVARNLLDAAADDLLLLLSRLRGKHEFRLRASYAQDVALREAVAANPAIGRLQRRVREGAGGYHDRIQLGEAVAATLEDIKRRDTAYLLDRLSPVSDDSVALPSTSSSDNVAVVFLVARAQLDAFDRALDEVAATMEGRMTLELTGPLAPWDFVAAGAPLLATSGAG
jgi:hypothetical protein